MAKPTLRASLRAMARLDDDATAALMLLVEHARADGWTWREIGEALGVSHQAINQRHRNWRRGRNSVGAWDIHPD